MATSGLQKQESNASLFNDFPSQSPSHEESKEVDGLYDNLDNSLIGEAVMENNKATSKAVKQIKFEKRASSNISDIGNFLDDDDGNGSVMSTQSSLGGSVMEKAMALTGGHRKSVNAVPEDLRPRPTSMRFVEVPEDEDDESEAPPKSPVVVVEKKEEEHGSTTTNSPPLPPTPEPSTTRPLSTTTTSTTTTDRPHSVRIVEPEPSPRQPPPPPPPPTTDTTTTTTPEERKSTKSTSSNIPPTGCGDVSSATTKPPPSTSSSGKLASNAVTVATLLKRASEAKAAVKARHQPSPTTTSTLGAHTTTSNNSRPKSTQRTSTTPTATTTTPAPPTTTTHHPHLAGQVTTVATLLQRAKQAKAIVSARHKAAEDNASTSSPVPYINTTNLANHSPRPSTCRSDVDATTVFTSATSRSKGSKSRLDAWDDALERRSKMGNTIASIAIPEDLEDVDEKNATYFQRLLFNPDDKAHDRLYELGKQKVAAAREEEQGWASFKKKTAAAATNTTGTTEPLPVSTRLYDVVKYIQKLKENEKLKEEQQMLGHTFQPKLTSQAADEAKSSKKDDPVWDRLFAKKDDIKEKRVAAAAKQEEKLKAECTFKPTLVTKKKKGQEDKDEPVYIRLFNEAKPSHERREKLMKTLPTQCTFTPTVETYGDCSTRATGMRRINELYELGHRCVTEERVMEEAKKPVKERDDDEVQCTFHPITNWSRRRASSLDIEEY